MIQAHAGRRRRVDRVLADDFLDDLDRARLSTSCASAGNEAEQEEADLSYIRRLLQGRMDIVRAEQRRRGRRDRASRSSTS